MRVITQFTYAYQAIAIAYSLTIRSNGLIKKQSIPAPLSIVNSASCHGSGQFLATGPCTRLAMGVRAPGIGGRQWRR